MAHRRRWVYTEKGKPRPGGPVEVEPPRGPIYRNGERQPDEAPAPVSSGPNPDEAWTDYEPPEGE